MMHVSTTSFVALLLLLLSEQLAPVNSLESQGADHFVQHFQALAPQGRLAGLQLLAQWSALQRVSQAAAPGSGGSEAAAAVQAGLRRVQEELHALLPQLGLQQQPAGEDPERLRRAAEGALAASLAAPAPAGRSRLARALTLVNIAWFCGCVLLVAAGVSLVGSYLAGLLLLVPLPAWEALGYAASLLLVRRGLHAAPAATAPFLALTGLLMLTACAGATLGLHCPERLHGSERTGAAFMALCALLYGAVAVRLQASLLGTMAVWWAMSALGFFIVQFPFLTVIGFSRGMARPFTASLTLILAFLPFKAAPSALPAPAWLRPFEAGVWLWCTLVLNVANLILAHQSWERGGSGLPPPEIWAQLPLRLRLRLLGRVAARFLRGQLQSVVVIAGTLACGVVLDVEQCRAVGAVFGFLWLMSKLAELDWKRVGFAWAALAFGAVLWGFAYAVHAWPWMLKLQRGS